MSTGRRILRITLIVLVVVLFTGYFAFSTFFFSPLEGDYDSDVSTLIPRAVDFYVSKAGLADDFEEFPTRLKVSERFFASEGGRALAASPEFQQLERDVDLAGLRAQLDEVLAQIPIGVDPLKVAGGRDLAIAGYFRGKAQANWDFAAYVRTNWMGKLGASALQYPGLLGLEQQGITAVEKDGVVSLQGPNLTRNIHVARVRDVLVIGTDEELVRSSLTYEAGQGEDSFGQSARYDDHINEEGRPGDEAELFVDMRAYLEQTKWPGNWPNSHSDDFGPALLGKLFQLGALNELIGKLDFGNVISVDLHGEFASDKVTAVQKRLYRARQLDTGTVTRKLAAFAPADVGAFLCFSSDLGDLLRQAFVSFEVAGRNNLDDMAREVWGYPDLQPLLADIDAALGGRVAVFVRENTYPDEGENGPPHDGRRVLVWALVGEVDNASKVIELRDKVIQNQQQFGIEGRPGTNQGGVFTHDTPRGSTVYEFWSPFISGTGHLSMILDGDSFVLSNHHLLIEDALQASYGSEGYPSLADDPSFALRLRDGLPSVTVALWLNARAVRETLLVMAEDLAGDQVIPDVRAKRGEIEKLVLRRDYPGKTQTGLTAEERSSFDAAVDVEVGAWRDEFLGQHVPELAEKYRRYISLAEMFDGVLLGLSFDPKTVDLALRAGLPLD